MNPSRILLLGANGQLGYALASVLPALGSVKCLTRAQADLSQPEALRVSLGALADTFKPTAIVNAAAYTAVDKAQTDIATATAVNAKSVGVLAELANACGAMLVHYSTDYVFDGTGDQPWRETDATHPVSVYGQTKLAGEQAGAKTCARHLILRASWVVGVHGSNFLKTMLRLAAERKELRVVADQVGVPTSTVWLAAVTAQLMQAMTQAEAGDPRWGVYHVVPAGETNWCSYAQHVIVGAMARGTSLQTAPQAVQPIATADYPLPAPRPHNSRLDTHKLQRTFDIAPPTWQAGVDAVLDELLGPINT